MLEAALPLAAAKLTETLGTQVGLGFVEALRVDDKGPVVARCRVLGSDSAPPTVIVKMARRWDAYDPDKAGGPAGALLTEWAALEWLGELGVVEVPQLMGADRDAGLLVLSDVRHDRRVDALLLADDPAAASAALVSFGGSLGRLHAATLGATEDEWNHRRSKLGPFSARQDRSGWFSDQVDAFHRACASLAIDCSGTDDDLERVREMTTGDGPSHCLVQGDPCPDNLLVRNQQVFIVDFEIAGWWYAPRDAVYARTPFPTCWCMGLVPESVIADVESAYRREAGFLDNHEWAHHVAIATAQWFVWTVPHFVLRGLEKNDKWGTTGIRQRIAPRSASFSQAARLAGTLEGLALVAEEIERKVGELWQGESAIGPYPAFREWSAKVLSVGPDAE